MWLLRSDDHAIIVQVIDKARGKLQRLSTERKVLFLCSSPFVVTVFYAFEDADRLHLVMEVIPSDKAVITT